MAITKKAVVKKSTAKKLAVMKPTAKKGVAKKTKARLAATRIEKLPTQIRITWALRLLFEKSKLHRQPRWGCNRSR